MCGFSLGVEESTRLANISLIQVKEEAIIALLNTKRKLNLSSTTTNESDVRVTDPVESSDDQLSQEIQDSENRAISDINLLPVDQG